MSNFFKTIRGIFIKDEPEQQLAYTPQPDADQRGLIYNLKRYFVSRVEQDMRIWKRAVQKAEDVMRPRRTELYRLYHRAMEDDHLLAQVRTARFTVQMAPFRLERDGAEDEDATKILERPWFYEYLQHAVDSELYGHSLVEFHSRMEDGEFRKISLVPREHVRPEYGEVVLSIHDEKGLKYTDKPLNKYLLPIGEPYDLGLLKVASKLVIRKEYALTDWSRRNEKYGMPYMVVKTSSRKESEIKAKEDMAAQFGSNAYAILDDQDEVTLLETANQMAYQSFERYSDWADRAISMLVNGQTGTMDEKAYVGSAEVHERILNTYVKARMKRIQYHINYELLPFLAMHGYALEGYEFRFNDLDDVKGALPDSSDNDQAPQLSLEKKKLQPSIVLHYGEPCCDAHNYAQALDFALDQMMQETMRRVWEKKVKQGDLDADSWKYFSDELEKAFAQGFGATQAQISYQKATDWELVAQLRRNIHVFAAFKNHAAISDMTAALLDDAGNLREWEQYKQAVAPITGQYFENWLKAEYNTAIATGQTAAKWQQFQQNKDALPMLQYVTQRDALVREAHKAIDGVTLPVDDPFWDEYYPPNGWNCRCDIIQTAGPAKKPTIVLSEEQAPPVFRNNPGKTRELFPQSHPYFQRIVPAQRARLLRATAKLVYDNYDASWQKIAFNDNTGGYIVASTTAGAERYAVNLATAQRLIYKGDQIEILPGLENTPDIARNGTLWAVANASPANLLAALQDNARRADKILLNLTEEVNAGELRKKVRAWMQQNNTIAVVEIQQPNGNSIIIKQ